MGRHASSRSVIIGCDESGTGAVAGPYTIAAYVTYTEDQELLKESGVTDSKKLSDPVRRVLASRSVLEYSLFAKIEVVPASVCNELGLAESYKRAFVRMIEKTMKALKEFVPNPSCRVIIDGSYKSDLASRLAPMVAPIQFMPKADLKVPAVGAAGILAKTHRNDLMLKLHEKYPQYEWNRNFGYATKDHLDKIRSLGSVDEHRYVHRKE